MTSRYDVHYVDFAVAARMDDALITDDPNKVTCRSCIDGLVGSGFKLQRQTVGAIAPRCIRPGGVNVNVCIAEGCYGYACMLQQKQEAVRARGRTRPAPAKSRKRAC